MASSYAVRQLSRPFRATVAVPGSKSQTNRALLLAALAHGRSHLRGALFSDDSRVFVDSLQRLGVPVESDPSACSMVVQGSGGVVPAAHAELFVGNSGTSARFLTPLLTLGHGDFALDGVARMRERPIGDLLDALNALGADVKSVRGNGCPPVHVRAAGLPGGTATVGASRSGQFLSALLMVTPYAEHGAVLRLEGYLASAPYIDMTLAMMRDWGITVAVEGDPLHASVKHPAAYHVPSMRYSAREYEIAPDASGASYFLAAAAVTQGSVRVRNLALARDQGDLGLLRVLEQMGCRVEFDGNDVVLDGPAQLGGIDIDLNAMSDTAMTLAAIAPFAGGPVTLRNIGHIREKETDRITATVTELRRLGARVDEQPDGLTVYPSALHGAEVQTYDDHRMAMAFAITGLLVPGISIADPGCVAKTFPDFFDRLEAACRGPE